MYCFAEIPIDVRAEQLEFSLEYCSSIISNFIIVFRVSNYSGTKCLVV